MTSDQHNCIKTTDRPEGNLLAIAKMSLQQLVLDRSFPHTQGDSSVSITLRSLATNNFSRNQKMAAFSLRPSFQRDELSFSRERVS